ncbi:MAG: hypothetical protein AABW64_02720 [Nanoarchaeota archaeon]
MFTRIRTTYYLGRLNHYSLYARSVAIHALSRLDDPRSQAISSSFKELESLVDGHDLSPLAPRVLEYWKLHRNLASECQSVLAAIKAKLAPEHYSLIEPSHINQLLDNPNKFHVEVRFVERTYIPARDMQGFIGQEGGSESYIPEHYELMLHPQISQCDS